MGTTSLLSSLTLSSHLRPTCSCPADCLSSLLLFSPSLDLLQPQSMTWPSALSSVQRSPARLQRPSGKLAALSLPLWPQTPKPGTTPLLPFSEIAETSQTDSPLCLLERAAKRNLQHIPLSNQLQGWQLATLCQTQCQSPFVQTKPSTFQVPSFDSKEVRICT